MKLKKRKKYVTLKEVLERHSEKIDIGPVVWASLDEERKLHFHFLDPSIVQESIEKKLAESMKDLGCDVHFIYDSNGPTGANIPLYDLVGTFNIEGLQKLIAKSNEDHKKLAQLLIVVKKIINELYGSEK